LAASPRAVALEALLRIGEGAYANLVLPPLLARSGLDERDRGFVTELVYGTTRMLRACDWLLERFLYREVDDDVAAILRLGAYQLVFLQTPPHAAVGETVALASGRTKGLVNAVLRKVADAGPPRAEDWPDDATRLSYPDWIVERLVEDLGRDLALAALATMNESPKVTVREDGYVQDEASQRVAALVGAGEGERVADLCAAPGGKATWLAGDGAGVVAAGDVNPTRTGLVADNARRLGRAAVAPYVGDGRRAPFRPGTFDRVLLDAPCSGLGVLRRRPDARWRVSPEDVDDLVALQHELLDEAARLVRPGGHLVYSVCTLTTAESEGIDRWLIGAHPELEPEPAPEEPWAPLGRGARLLPQSIGSDGMYVLRLRRAR
jgi:16S rRNA (cytosine967-C5)-methyltransferase